MGKICICFLTGVESHWYHAIKARVNELQLVGWSRQEEGGRVAVPVLAHAHTHRLAVCDICALRYLHKRQQ